MEIIPLTCASALVVIAAGVVIAVISEFKPKPSIMCDSCKHLQQKEGDKYICPFLKNGYSYQGATYCERYKEKEINGTEE